MPLGPLRVLGSRVVDGSAEANAARVDAMAGPSVFSMRGCLESRHDWLMWDLTVDYWNADVGS